VGSLSIISAAHLSERRIHRLLEPFDVRPDSSGRFAFIDSMEGWFIGPRDERRVWVYPASATERRALGRSAVRARRHALLLASRRPSFVAAPRVGVELLCGYADHPQSAEDARSLVMQVAQRLASHGPTAVDDHTGRGLLIPERRGRWVRAIERPHDARRDDISARRQHVVVALASGGVAADSAA